MLPIKKVHHVAIICSDYPKSKSFYTQTLGLSIIREIYRKERESYKLDLALNGIFIIELFSYNNPPQRTSNPEAAGLRHLAFEVNDLDQTISILDSKKITSDAIRVDLTTGKRFTFIADPDGLPIEFYEI
jgi:glyoxylase I family protein